MYQGQIVFDGHVAQLTQEAVRQIYGADELDESLTTVSLHQQKEHFQAS
jgi:ABC-type phosphate/phosphonate transport system ATPase subunit